AAVPARLPYPAPHRHLRGERIFDRSSLASAMNGIEHWRKFRLDRQKVDVRPKRILGRRPLRSRLRGCFVHATVPKSPVSALNERSPATMAMSQRLLHAGAAADEPRAVGAEPARRGAFIHYPSLVGLLVAHALAVLSLPYVYFYGIDIWEAAFHVVAAIAGGFGITALYHRAWAHNAVNFARPVEYILATCSGFMIQMPARQWISTHIRHHRHTDHDQDPYN